MRTPTDLKSVGANYLFTADEICNIVAIRFVISPIRITPIVCSAVVLVLKERQQSVERIGCHADDHHTHQHPADQFCEEFCLIIFHGVFVPY